MKTKRLLSATALVVLLIASGCATRTTASGGRQTTILGGASTGNPTGKKTTLFWGLLTFHDY